MRQTHNEATYQTLLEVHINVQRKDSIDNV